MASKSGAIPVASSWRTHSKSYSYRSDNKFERFSYCNLHLRSFGETEFPNILMFAVPKLASIAVHIPGTSKRITGTSCVWVQSLAVTRLPESVLKLRL